MSWDLPVGPFFVPPLKEESGGVDFLGLRQANLDLIAHCLPGINNVTWHLRPFSLLCWIYWQFYRLTESRAGAGPSERDLRLFREKVEVLFTWSHQLSGVGGLPGISAQPRDDSAQPLLTFEAWGRQTNSTSLMAPIQYGPASKTTAGLGLLEPVGGSVFRVRGHGVELAEALNESLSMVADRSELDRLGSGTATPAYARQLLAGWDIRAPTPQERRAFRSALYNPAHLQQDDGPGRRSRTLAAIIEVLQSIPDPCTPQAIRASLTFATLPDGTPLDLPVPLLQAQEWWLVLQLRQAQRLALEALFGWIEKEVQCDQAFCAEDLAKMASGVLTADPRWPIGDTKVAHLRAEMRQRLGAIGTWWEVAQGGWGLEPFRLMAEITEALAADYRAVLTPAFRLLLLVGRLTELLQPARHLLPGLDSGGAERISLLSWGRTLDRCEAKTLQDFLRFVFENYALSQHFAVATRRYDGQSQRLRLTIEERGIMALTTKPWQPIITPDRLETGLSLMSECDLVLQEGDRYTA